MSQMTIKDLKLAISNLDDDLEVFFRRVADGFGNIEEAYTLELSEYSFFGKTIPCAILEPSVE